MKIVIPGGTGQVGRILTRYFDAREDDVVILSRTGPSAEVSARVVTWDGKSLSAWAEEIDGADAVINLAGQSVDCRYHVRNRRAIMDSRVNSTRVIGEAISRARRPPRVWLQAGTATVYAHRYDAPNDEATGIIGGHELNAPSTWNFSIDVAKAWERTLNEARTPHTRKVVLRSAMTMSPDVGGVFDVLLRLVRLGLGGRVGDGRQFVSWIHEFDFVRAVDWLLDNEHLDGPVNLASPHPIPHESFMRELRAASGIVFSLPTTKWMLEIGAFLLRTESELVLKSRRVVPGRLLADGFAFHYPHWTEAARELCERRRPAATCRSSRGPVAQRNSV